MGLPLIFDVSVVSPVFNSSNLAFAFYFLFSSFYFFLFYVFNVRSIIYHGEYIFLSSIFSNLQAFYTEMGSSFSRSGTAFFFYAHLSEDYLFSGAPTTHSCSIHALFQICNWLLRRGLAPLHCLQPQDSGFHMIHSTDEGFLSGAPHLWIYWHFFCWCCFVSNFSSNSNSV